MSGSKVIDVVAAIIIKKDKILLCQRSESAMHALKWEFPGGKIKKDETAEKALCREIYEELKLEITEQEFLLKKTHFYAPENLTVNLTFFYARIKSEMFQNKVFQNIQFISPEEIENYDLLDADKNALPELMTKIKTYHS